MAGTRKIGALDGLRALSILAILVYHANPSWLPGGYLGVSVFFCLTGYLTTVSIERRIAEKGSLGYARFVAGRAARLWPAMLAVVGVAAVLCALFSTSLLPKVKSDAVPALLFAQNVYYIVREVSYFAAAGLPSPLTHFWFLGVTMQFYVLWPLLLLGLSRLCRKRSHACAVVAVLLALSAVEMAVLYDPMADTARIYYGLDTRAAELLAGCLCALLTRGRGWKLTFGAGRGPNGEKVARPVPSWAYDVAGVASLAAIVALMFALNGYSDFAYRGGLVLTALLTAVFIGVVARKREGVLAKVVGCAPLRVAGARAYAVYLWHYPLFCVLNPATRTTALPWWGWALEFLLIAVVAEVSYRLFEKRGSGLLAPFKLGQSKPALAFEALGVAAALVLLVVPLSAESTGVPTAEQEAATSAESETDGEGEGETEGETEGGDASQAASFDPATEAYDLSSTYLAGTSFAGAVDTINSISYDVDVETGTTGADVLLIGDSVPLGAESQFNEIFSNGYIDAAVGRQIWDALDVYNAAVEAGHGAANVVWACGDNGVAREDTVRSLIEACGSDKKIYFVTVRVPLALQDINNALFWQMAEEYDNVEVIDWYAESEGHSEYFWDDGTHLRPEGAEAYVLMLRRAITGR